MRLSTIVLATILLCPISTARSGARQYFLDASKSALYVQVFKDRSTLASALAHDHVVLATDWRARVVVDPAELSECVVEVIVPVDGLRPDLPEMRTLVGYEVMLSEGQQRSVGEQMRAESQLDRDRFPEITFHSQSCNGTGGDLEIHGDLTIRGKSKGVMIPVKVSYADEIFRANGSFRVQHSDFGFAPYSAFFGAVRNRSDIHFEINVVGKVSR